MLLMRAGLLFFISVNIFLSSLFLSWQLNRSAGYLYPFFYKQLHISEHIKAYAPWNQLKKDFQSVGAAEHKRIFHEIAHAIHNHGIGLADLSYYGQDGLRIDTCLTVDEVAHLREVAAVVTIITWFGLLNLAVTVLIIYLSLRKKIVWPSFKQICIVGGTGLLLCLLVLAVAGFNKIFYQFHVLAFNEAPWIFSYEQSLLIVLTKSPQLFSFIALLIFLPAFLFFLFFMFFLSRFYDH